MDIEIKNFRKISANYGFKDDTLTLVNGKSGSGKTTIFNATKWCFFGTPLIKNKNKKRCNVVIKTLINGEILTVDRKSNPTLLQVNYRGEDYEGKEVAQELINSLIGKVEIWDITSYVHQKMPNSFFTAKPAERMSFLNTISFGDQNPEQYIETLVKYIKFYKEKKKIVEAQYLSELTRFEQIKRQYPFDEKNCVGKLKSKEERLETINQKIKRAKSLLIERDILDKAKEKCKTRLETLQESLHGDSLMSSDEYREIVENLKILERKQEEFEELNREFNKLKLKNLVYHDHYTPEYLMEVKIAEKNRKELEKLCDSVDIKCVSEEISKIKNLLMDQDKIKNKITLVNTYQKLLKLLEKTDDISLNDDEVEVLRQNNRIYNNNIKICKEVGIDYKENIIAEKLKLLEICDKINENNLLILEIKKLGNFEEIDDFDLEKVKNQWKIYESGVETCKKLKIKYSKESIEKFINENDRIIKHQEDARLWSSFNKLQEESRKEVNEDLENLTEVGDNKLEEFSVKIKNAIDGLGVLKCPCCDKDLRLVNGVLQNSSVGISDQKAIDTMKKSLEIMRKKDKLYKQYLDLKDLLDFDYKDVPLKTTANISNLLGIIQTLKNIEVIDEPEINIVEAIKTDKGMRIKNKIDYSLPTVKIDKNVLVKLYKIELIDKPKYDNFDLDAYEKYKEVLGKIKDIEIKLGEIEDVNVDDVLSEKITKKKKQFLEIKYTSNVEFEHKYLEECVKFNEISLRHGEEKRAIDELKEKYNYEMDLKEAKKLLLISEKDFLAKKEIERLEKDILDIEKNNAYEEDIISIMDILTVEKNKCTKHIENLSNKEVVLDNWKVVNEIEKGLTEIERILLELNNLKEIAVKTMICRLEDVCDNINTCLEDLMEEFFNEDDDVEVRIELFNEPKSTGIEIPKISLYISKEGEVYDSFSDLSGGECDRISIAFTVALGTISNSKIVIFDESLSSLDVKNKDASIDIIKKYLNNKIVLVVSHDTAETLFDDIVEISR